MYILLFFERNLIERRELMCKSKKLFQKWIYIFLNCISFFFFCMLYVRMSRKMLPPYFSNCLYVMLSFFTSSNRYTSYNPSDILLAWAGQQPGMGQPIGLKGLSCGLSLQSELQQKLSLVATVSENASCPGDRQVYWLLCFLSHGPEIDMQNSNSDINCCAVYITDIEWIL